MKVKTKHCYNICFAVSPLKTFEAHTLVGVTLMDGDAVRSLSSLSHESEGCRVFVMFSSFFQADKILKTSIHALNEDIGHIYPGIPTTIKTMGVNITIIDYLRVLIIEIGSTIILMVVEA